MKAKGEEIVLKLLHTADWHLGRRFRSFRDEAALMLSRARLDVLVRVFGEADRNQVDAVLCAGDLFDEAQPPREFIDGLVERLRHTETRRPIYLLPGNHDPAQSDSVWLDAAFRKALPAHVHVVEKATEYSLGNEAVLYAVPCLSRASQKDPTEQIPKRAAGDERVRVGLVHGSTFDAADAALHFPIAADAAVTRGLDYLAIGDTHGFRFVPDERKHPPTVYPGAPEQTAFDERDAGHVAVVFINRHRRATVHPQRVGAWRWEERTVRTLAELELLTRQEHLQRTVLRLHVDMVLTAQELEHAERLLASLEGTTAKHGLAGVLELDRRRLELDVSNVDGWTEKLPSVLQATVRSLRARAQNPDERSAAQRALFHLYQSTRNG